MKIHQFVKTRSVGLDIGSGAVRIVELVRFMGKMRMTRFGEEQIPVSDGSDDATVHAIRSLMSSLKIRQKEVAIHLESNWVRHEVMEAPAMSPINLQEWIRQQFMRKYSLTSQPEQWAVSYHIIEKHEKGFTVLAAFCQSDPLTRRIRLTEKAGLVPVAVGGGRLDLFQAFVLNGEEVFNQTVRFVDLQGERIHELITRNGVPVHYSHKERIGMIPDSSNLSEFMESLLSKMTSGTTSTAEKTILTGPESFGFSENQNSALRPGVPLRNMSNGGQHLESKYSLAAGLAVKRYFPALNAIDLLSDDQRKKIRQAREKRRAMRFILAAGTLIFSLMILLNLQKSSLERRLSASEESLLLLQDKIFAVEAVKKEQEKLKNALTEMQSLVSKRSEYARMMDRLSRHLPSGLWFGSVHCVTPGEGTDPALMQIQLSGWALHENNIADFLASLEKDNCFSGLRLNRTEKLSPEAVWKKSRVQKRSLIHFLIEMEMHHDG